MAGLRGYQLADAPNGIEARHINDGAITVEKLSIEVVSGLVGLAKADFTFSSMSPIALGSVAVGGNLSRFVLLVTTAFDDPTASIAFGTSSAPNMILAPGDIPLAFAEQYNCSSVTVFSLVDVLILSILSGASTQGAATLYYALASS